MLLFKKPSPSYFSNNNIKIRHLPSKWETKNLLSWNRNNSEEEYISTKRQLLAHHDTRHTAAQLQLFLLIMLPVQVYPQNRKICYQIFFLLLAPDHVREGCGAAAQD